MGLIRNKDVARFVIQMKAGANTEARISVPLVWGLPSGVDRDGSYLLLAGSPRRLFTTVKFENGLTEKMSACWAGDYTVKTDLRITHRAT